MVSHNVGHTRKAAGGSRFHWLVMAIQAFAGRGTKGERWLQRGEGSGGHLSRESRIKGMLAEAGSDDEIVVEVEKMTREAGNYGGDHSDYGAQHQVRRVFPADAEDEESSGYRDNRLRQNFIRAGHVARGVIVIL